ncbi:HAD-IIIC family phosphatase [Paracoccus onubensis]|nr:HAD-IIIC family phosphatase [Paracoccus onubensis]
MSDPRFAIIDKDVKVVIWDLDETFWNGTLSEGDITPVQAHIDLVHTLVDRGIMCSICSKNDFEQAKAELVRLGVWDKFVFPHIEWSPKGQAVRSILERMQLRDENALFLDDNHLNLEEVKYFSPRIACLDATGSTDGSQSDLSGLAGLPQLRGKDDRDHARLQQYRVLETKEQAQISGNLSNEEFLRQSDIQIKIIADFEDRMDRVYELINRTNQLNFTKQRVTTDEQKAELQELLRIPGVHAGLIHVRDKYGDYGLVGFFCLRRRFNGTVVHHFAFSCRTLNMGVEQWVWNHLERPEFEIAKPVANSLDIPAEVGWIRQVDEFGDAAANAGGQLCLVGGCDLQQVSFYCGSERDEFVNKPDDDGLIVRYDDAGFFLNPREQRIANHWALNHVAGHNLAEMEALDKSLKASDVIILSMFFAFLTKNLFTYGFPDETDRYLLTIPPKRLFGLVRQPKTAIQMLNHLHHLDLDEAQRLNLVRRSFEKTIGLMRPDAKLFILGAAEQIGEQAARTSGARAVYNTMCREFCEAHPGAIFIDVEKLVPAEEFVDSDHYTRKGYFKIANFINMA